MAVDATIPQIWSARITHYLSGFSAFVPNANRVYEGDANVGNVVKVPSIDRSTVIRDYSRTQDLAAPEDIDSTTQDLLIDQGKYFNFALEDLDARQNRIPASVLMDSKAAGAAEGLANEVDDFVASRLGGITDANFLGGAPTAGSFDLNFTSLAKRRATSINQPRSSLVCITTPEVVEDIDEGIIDRTYGDVVAAQNLIAGLMQDPTATTAGFVGRINGIGFYTSNSTRLRQTSAGARPSGNARGDRSVSYILDPRDLALVVQVNQVETYRQERRFGTGVKGLVAFGAKVLNAGRMQKFVHTDA